MYLNIPVYVTIGFQESHILFEQKILTINLSIIVVSWHSWYLEIHICDLKVSDVDDLDSDVSELTFIDVELSVAWVGLHSWWLDSEPQICDLRSY